jgi:hypothetical protein
MYLISDDHDRSQQDVVLLPSIFIQSQRWEDRSGSLKFHSRSSLTIPATMNKQNSVLRISFSLWGNNDCRLVIKVVKESRVLFEIEDWTQSSYEWSKIDRCYHGSHDFIKNLQEGCHFELHYANFIANRAIEIKDFNLSIHGKLTDNDTIDAMSLYMMIHDITIYSMI